jgi:hypothetical protein
MPEVGSCSRFLFVLIFIFTNASIFVLISFVLSSSRYNISIFLKILNLLNKLIKFAYVYLLKIEEELGKKTTTNSRKNTTVNNLKTNSLLFKSSETKVKYFFYRKCLSS